MSSISKSTRAKIVGVLGTEFYLVSTGKFFADFPDKRKKRYTVRESQGKELIHLFEYEDGSIKSVRFEDIDLKAQPQKGIKQIPVRYFGELTPPQFDALAKLLQSRGGAAESAARLVLVDDWGPADAARNTSLAPASVSNAVTRYRRAYALALIVAADAPPDWYIKAAREQLSASIRAEREACAALCDLHAAHYSIDTKQLTYKAASNSAQWLAKAIRARADTNGAGIEPSVS